MKNIRYIIMSFFVVWLVISPSFMIADDYFNSGKPTELIDDYYRKMKKQNDAVQETDLDGVSSSACADLAKDSRFTFTRTLCYVKNYIKDYIKYIVYFGLTIAVVFVIWNGFMLVTAQDSSSQMKKFTKNMKNIGIGVILLVGFYYIMEIFISVVNLIGE